MVYVHVDPFRDSTRPSRRAELLKICSAVGWKIEYYRIEMIVMEVMKGADSTLLLHCG